MKLVHLILMTRPGNSIMAAIGVVVGFLFSGNSSRTDLLLLIISASVSLGFGNVINDLYDIDTDKIAHPDRALPSGKITTSEAKLFMVILAIIALTASFLVSPLHGIATIIPLLLLIAYAHWLKGTPLAGNLLISALVAYTLVYGALGGRIDLAIIPAILAFITNMIREIVKDIADKDGDTAAGIFTTAHLSPQFVNKLILFLMAASSITAPLPIFYPEFRTVYPFIILLLVFPLQLQGFIQYKRKHFTLTAKLVKLQLLGGLIAFASEGIRYYFI